MTRDEVNRRICEKLGICWHEAVIYDGCSCGFSTLTFLTAHLETHPNPDFFSDAGKVQLLREMGKLENWQDFGQLPAYCYRRAH
jgi:hypothetical protein